MPATAETVVECKSALECLEIQLGKAVKTAPEDEQAKLNKLAAAIYEMLAIDKDYGKGPFEISMYTGEDSFALTLSTVRS